MLLWDLPDGSAITLTCRSGHNTSINKKKKSHDNTNTHFRFANWNAQGQPKVILSFFTGGVDCGEDPVIEGARFEVPDLVGVVEEAVAHQLALRR